MGQTTEEHRKNYNEKIYHVQCLIPVNMGTTEKPKVEYRKWIRYKGYRTGRQSLDAIRDFRRQNVYSWGYPWVWRIKIVK
jgi:hypothetical protein